ncbi:MAG TPA: pyridine nucleotide-disulfide oxidoreductase [Gammaproteobacteria bacterium]|nr:pyridine nucleotide-disulfide oxidoreductase [Gammaproteobacteria bacterium]
MAHCIVIGASIGGLATAYELRAKLSTQHQITVIADTATFHFVPSNPWVATGFRQAKQTSLALLPYLTAKNIQFLDSGVTHISPDKQQVQLGDGQCLQYDYLVVATGAKHAFDEISGFGPDDYTQSICTLSHAEQAYQRWQQFIMQPGPIIVGAVQGASCFGPAYEYVLMLNQLLRQANIRDQVPMTFVTSEPYIGHLGLGGVGDSKSLLESELRHNDIRFINNAAIDAIRPNEMVIKEYGRDGKVFNQQRLAFDYAMLIPAFSGVPCVAALDEKLINARGFLYVDDYQRSPDYPNLYGVGVCVAIPPVEKTPVAVGVPKTGYMIESMASAAAQNIVADIKGQQATTKASWHALCLADLGHTGAAFVAMPQIPPRNRVWIKKGKWVRWAKIAFEKYFLYKVKTGSTEPVYERILLRLFGISKNK